MRPLRNTSLSSQNRNSIWSILIIPMLLMIVGALIWLLIIKILLAGTWLSYLEACFTLLEAISTFP